jgi:hypothetical protein
MMLLELQRRMAKAVMQPLTGSDRIALKTRDGRPMRIEISEFIRPNDRLTSIERLEIYSRSYWFRVLDSLCDDFPGLRAVLGKRAFHRLSRAYLSDCPSQSFTLGNLGSRLERWLQRNPEYAGSGHALALDPLVRDMVRLEWAHIEAFDSVAEKVLGPEDLLELGPSFRAGLQPYIRLLALEYPVDELRIHVNQASEEHGTASNAVLKQKHRNLTRRVRRLKRERIYLAVHRFNSMVYYRRIAAEEYGLLNALREGQPIGMAIQTGFKNSSVTSDEQRSMLEKWFAAWAELGWLCPPARVKIEKVTE